MKCGKFELKFDRTLIMGILNVTPDSFSDGGKFLDTQKAVQQAHQMIKEGADIIDIGGESTKPGSDPVSSEEELKRVLPVIEALKDIKIPISIDSNKPDVVDTCLEAGASLVNDVTGLRNPEMIKVIAKHKVPVIIMHMLGDPKTMQNQPEYNDVVKEVKDYLSNQASIAKKAGIKDIIIDVGIGFGKTVEHNLELIKRLDEFTDLEYPILIGPSRKSFIGKLTGKEVEDRLEGTLSAVAACVLNGANIVRVHDVKECKQVIIVAEAING